MSARAIRTSTQQEPCDVCGRTLLRGERAEIYLSGGARHSVCALCTSRALHGGWVREGEMPEYEESSARVDRRRSLFGRRRPRRDADASEAVQDVPPSFGDDPELLAPPPAVEPPPGTAPEWPEPASRPERRSRRRRQGPEPAVARESSVGREPRHVRAVPTSIENKIASAIELFNGSEHPKTVSGIARSLGVPDVSVHPSDPVASVVNVVVSWELCWYRYEVDLSDEVPSVRVGGQGYELVELSELERQINATADDRGRLALSD